MIDSWRKQLDSPWLGPILGVLAGLTYGLVARFAFSISAIMGVWGIMTLGFIFWLPMALGALTVFIAQRKAERTWVVSIFLPWVPALLGIGSAVLLGWEGTICVVMALPVYLLMASLGGYLVWLGTRHILPSAPNTVLVATLALLPFLSAQIEQNFELPIAHRQVETEILIEASPSSVWQNIIRVPAIEDNEQRTLSFHVLGFPKPIEATLSHEGVGGIRHASFEGGLVFVETITVWEPERELAFGIQVDPEMVPATTLDEHVVVGGPFFETLDGRYRIEPMEDGGVLLHLESTHRLSTRFNFYSRWWSDLIMRDIQNYILVILKKRCEEQERGI